MKLFTKSNTAKIAAGLVGFAFVFSLFVTPVTVGAQTSAELQAMINSLLAQIAALQGQVGSSSTSHTFTMDLTVGSTGAEVTALQSFLESKGFLTMPAGVAKGYFGNATQAAVAAYQSSKGITPASGYWGPVTRASANAGVVVVPPPTTNNNNNNLGGGEASLESYELTDEESSGAEGEENVEIATIEFDVEDADAMVERIEVDFQAEDVAQDSENPWDYFDSVSLWVDGDMIAEMDTDSRADWDSDDADSVHDVSAADWHRLNFTGLDLVVEEGDTVEITIAANIASPVEDTGQEFTVLIDDEGIRATDGEGIQQYTGDDSETVSDFGFDEEESGDLDIQTSSDDPDVMTLISDDESESEDYTVFVFEMENNDSVDTMVTDIEIDVATSSGDVITALIDQATLVVDGEEFDGDVSQAEGGIITFDDMDLEIAGDETVTFELVISLKEDATESTIDFTITSGDVQAEGVESGDDATIDGTVSSETHTISTAGILVEGTDKSTGISEDGDTGTFTLEFTVEALEEDVYIYNGAVDYAVASSSGIVYNIYRGGVIGAAATTTDSATIQSTADTAGLGSAWFKVSQGETEEFTLTVSLNPDSSSSALYSVELESIRFDDDAATTVGDTVYTLPNDSEFETNARQID